MKKISDSHGHLRMSYQCKGTSLFRDSVSANPLDDIIQTEAHEHLSISNFHNHSWFALFELIDTPFLEIYDDIFYNIDTMHNEAYMIPFSIKERGEYT